MTCLGPHRVTFGGLRPWLALVPRLTFGGLRPWLVLVPRLTFGGLRPWLSLVPRLTFGGLRLWLALVPRLTFGGLGPWLALVPRLTLADWALEPSQYELRVGWALDSPLSRSSSFQTGPWTHLAWLGPGITWPDWALDSPWLIHFWYSVLTAPAWGPRPLYHWP